MYAADGPVLIDQDRAMAGGVTQGDDPGFPITISQPGSYRLVGNLTVQDANTSAIEITTGSVTLDLNGFSIIGPIVCSKNPTVCPAVQPGVPTPAGILAGDPTIAGIRVFNGTVRGMSSGIFINAKGSTVERVTAINNAAGGFAVEGGTIAASQAIQNGAFGMIGLIVRDSSALENAADGIVLNAGGVASGNVSSYNGGIGIYVPFGTATGNTVLLNNGSAILSLCPSIIASNTIVATDALTIETRNPGCAASGNATRP